MVRVPAIAQSSITTCGNMVYDRGDLRHYLHHIQVAAQKYPKVAKMLENAIYVDDVTLRAESGESAEVIYSQVQNLFRDANMELHKWDHAERTTLGV